MNTDDMIHCPYCGESIKRDAKACPNCGSDEMTGWSEFSYMDGIDTVDEEEYDEIYENEFSEVRSRMPVKQIIIASLLLVVFLILLIQRLL